jgi:hypothetical protein
MPKLDEIRRWLRGGKATEELPEHWKEARRKEKELEDELGELKMNRKLDVAKARKKHERRMYEVSIDGADAKLNFGKFEGWKVSDMAGTKSGVQYLQWVLQQDFPRELKDIIAMNGVV